jgi:AcrR family transcriptional regulator
VSQTNSRPVRADARRNRDLLLDAAVRAFANDGADVTLDAIAKSAGVGIGTLYRHFPTRDALVEAAYRQELAHLCDAVPGLLRSLPPDEATRTWMDRFIDYMTTKLLHGRGASSRHRLRRGSLRPEPRPADRGYHHTARRRC